MFLILSWLAISTFLVFCLRRVDYGNLQFIHGVLFGAVYYISVPMFPILILDEHNTIFKVPRFVPSRDLETMGVLFLGLFLIGCISLALGPARNRSAASLNFKFMRDNFVDNRTVFSVYFFVFINIFFLVFSFILSGKLDGGHWAEAESSTPTLFVLVAGISNFLRTSAYGALLYLNTRGVLSNRSTILFCLLLSIFDVALTFNRVSLVYFAIIFLIINRRFIYIIFPIFLLSFPVISYISSIWTIFRGLALVDGYNFRSIGNAFDIATSVDLQANIDSTLFSIFESANISVLNYIVDRFGVSTDFLYGWTYFGRMFLVFIPSTIWPDKPPVFGLILGQLIQGADGLALNSTLFGEVFGNFGWFWPLPLSLTLIVVNQVFRRLQTFLPFSGFVGAFVGIAIWRFDAGFIGVSLFSLIVVFILIDLVTGALYGRPERRGG